MQTSVVKKLNIKICSRRTSQSLTKMVSYLDMILHVSVRKEKESKNRKRMEVLMTRLKRQNLRLIIVAKAMMVKIIKIVSRLHKNNRSSIMNSSTRLKQIKIQYITQDQTQILKSAMMRS